MFGHQDNLNPQQDNHAAAPEPQADATLAHDMTTPSPAPVAPTTLPSPAASMSSMSPSATSSDDDHAAASSAPTVADDDDNDTDTAGDFIMTDPHPAVGTPATPVASSQATTPAQPAPETDDLLQLKQGALQQLSPLLDHLDQTPEEKFRTTMMMIQATDNHALLKTAYEAAQNIEDEKVRAQALLDVVNEINYFTQQQNGDGEKAEESDEPSL